MQTQTDADGIRELSDPEFLTMWSAARIRVALTWKGSPERESARETYAVLTSEYRRRMGQAS